MVRRLLESMARWRSRASTGSRPRLFFDEAPEVVYAVGDIHGCYELLLKMEKRISEDAAAITGEKWIVLLGDYVDRGPQSADVLDHLLLPPPKGFTRHCLAGNHEELMLSYLTDPDPGHMWLGLGGQDTLRSYGLDETAAKRSSTKALLASHIPLEHVDFLRRAPSLVSIPGFVFVHAGLRSGVPLQRQSDEDLMWIRPDDSQGPPSPDFITVHGHTPVPSIESQPGRINVDTGAFATAILSCVRIDRRGKIVKLAVR